jgi:hypothetical protein
MWGSEGCALHCPPPLPNAHPTNLRHSPWFVRRGCRTGVRETVERHRMLDQCRQRSCFRRCPSVPFGTSMRGERNYTPVSTLERMEPT